MKKVDINYIKTEFEKIQNYFTRRDYAKVIEKTRYFLSNISDLSYHKLYNNSK